MSSTSQFTTFSDLYTGILNAVRSQTSQAATVVIAKRYVNVALQDMHLGTDYVLPWVERQNYITTSAPYSTGTVSITQGSTTVTGTGTLWNTTVWYGNNVEAAFKIRFSGSDAIYEVSAVGSDTGITISEEWHGEDDTDATYVAWKDTYALETDYHKPVDARFFDDHREIQLLDRKQLRRKYPNNSTTGKPRFATMIELGPSGSTALRPRIVFYPPPDVARHIPYSYVTTYLAVASNGTLATALSGDTDEPVVPLRYRHAIFYKALALFYEHKDDARFQSANAMYDSVMQRILSDHNIGQNRMRVEPRVGHYTIRAERPYTQSGSGTRRFDTSSGAFDRLS